MVRVNIAFVNMCFKEYLIIFLMICSLIVFAFVFLLLLMIKVCGITGIAKVEFFNFSSSESVNKNENKNHSKPPNLVSQLLCY